MDVFYLACTYILAGVTGLCVGSFLNVLIYRLPRGMNIAKPPSHCPDCGYRLKWYDNIPVLSYALLRGRCRGCGEKISPRYMLVETLNCALWLAAVAAFYGYGIGYTVVAAVSLSCLTVVFFCDLETMIVPDSMVIGLALSGAAGLILELCGAGVGLPWQERLFGILLGFGFFALFYFGCILFLKREGLGFGDVKLMGAAGFLLGWKSTFLCILLATVAAAVVLTALRMHGRKKTDGQADLPSGDSPNEEGEAAEKPKEKKYPLAPFLCAAAAFCLFFGDAVCSLYIRLLTGS